MADALVNYCKRCKKEVSHEDIRLDKDGKTIICKDCNEAKKEAVKSKIETYSALDKLEIEPVENELEKEKPDVKQEPGAERYIVYHCKDCNYKFSRKMSTNFNLVCPYCGKQSVERFKDNLSAEKLLAESEEIA